MPQHRPNTRPYCFGRLDTVFPMGADGLRATPEGCMVCHCKTECLRQAMAGPDGDQVRREHLHRAEEAGKVGFFTRWSRKKMLERRSRERGRSAATGSKAQGD